jgi:hypothetical protein
METSAMTAGDVGVQELDAGAGMAAAGERGAAAGGQRLKASVERTAGLDAATCDAAYVLFAAAYDGTDRSRFERDLAEKQLVILLRDARTGVLKGFSTVHVGAVPGGGVRGRGATVVFSGDTVIDPQYWGQKQLQKAFSLLMLRLKLRAPHRELYWFVVCKGYKTYLLMAHHLPGVPRVGYATPPAMQGVLDRVARQRFGGGYDPSTGVIANVEVDAAGAAHERVREGLATITPELLAADEHIRFFVQANPGHERGDELACLAPIQLRVIAGSVLWSAAAVVRGRRGRDRERGTATGAGT